MPQISYRTRPSWQQVSGAGDVSLQLRSGVEALVFIGAEAPASDDLAFRLTGDFTRNVSDPVWVKRSFSPSTVQVQSSSAAVPAQNLGPTSLTNPSFPAGRTYRGKIEGQTEGSTLSLTGAGAAGLAVFGRNILGTAQTEGPINIVETLAGAANSPRTTADAGLITARIPNPVNPGEGDGLKFIPKNNRITWVGDSRTLSQWQTTGGGYMEAKGAAMWLMQMAKGSVSHALADNFGTGGFSTKQVLDNHFPSGLASGCGIMIVPVGCNDPQSGSVPNVAASILNAQTMRDQAVAAGNLIVFCTEPTAPSIGPLGSANDNWIKDYSAALMAMRDPANGVLVADCRTAFAAYIAAHGGDTTKVFRDGIHWTGTGGLIWADEIWKVLAPHVTSFATDLFARPGSLNETLAALDGTDGSKGTGVTGDLATGWNGSVSNGTVVCSKVAKDGRIGQRFVGNFTAAAGNFNLFADYAPGGTGIASGDVMDFVCGFQNNAEAIGIRQAQFSARYNGGTVIPSFLDGANPQQSGVGFPSLGLPYEGIYRPVPKAVPGAANRLHALFTVDMPTDATAASFDITIWRPQFRKVV